MAARHATSRISLSKSSSGIHRPICGSVSLASSQQLSFDCTIPQRIATARMMGSNSSLIHVNTLNNDTSSSSSFAILAATIATTSSIAIMANNNNSTLCESPTTTNNNTEGLADETEEDNSSNSIIQDGMDAGSEIPMKSPKLDNLSTAEEDDDDSEDTNTANNNTNDGADTTNNNNNNEEEEGDDPSKDEQTSCSICLINRQGPCRKQWLKFEKCMKEHGAEQDREKARKEKDASKVSEELDGSVGGDGDSGVDDSIENNGEEKQSVSKEEMEGDWDDFMVKSTKPGEDDDDDDDDEDDDEEEDENEEESEDEETDNSNEEDTDTPSAQQQQEKDQTEDISLSQRCDKFMIPWISCIQEHRNIYSLISNDFYQKDYIDPLEYTVHDSRRLCYNKDHSEIGEVDGYVIKYHGVEIDLGSWREHVEAVSDESNVDNTTPSSARAVPTEEPHLINAYAKFQLSNPTNGQPIEVAYIKDQNGRLLGFDSFTKSKEESGGNSSDEESMPHKSEEEKAAAPPVSNDGECTFHILPGETKSITAYAIYRGDVVKKEDESNDEGGEEKVAGMREDFLFTTPAIPLPGMKNQK